MCTLLVCDSYFVRPRQRTAITVCVFEGVPTGSEIGKEQLDFLGTVRGMTKLRAAGGTGDSDLGDYDVLVEGQSSVVPGTLLSNTSQQWYWHSGTCQDISDQLMTSLPFEYFTKKGYLPVIVDGKPALLRLLVDGNRVVVCWLISSSFQACLVSPCTQSTKVSVGEFEFAEGTPLEVGTGCDWLLSSNPVPR